MVTPLTRGPRRCHLASRLSDPPKSGSWSMYRTSRGTRSTAKTKGTIMNADAILGMLTLGTYATMFAIEGLWPARTFPKIRLWKLVGVAFFVLIIALGIVMPLLLPVEWLAEHRLLDGTRL